jgi:hypothetical protein
MKIVHLPEQIKHSDSAVKQTAAYHGLTFAVVAAIALKRKHGAVHNFSLWVKDWAALVQGIDQ